MPWYLHLSDVCLQRTLEAISSKICDDAAQLSGAILLITSVPVACTVNQSFEWKLLSTDVCWSEYQFWWSLKLHAKTIINVLLRAFLHWLVLPTQWRMTPTEWDSRSHSWSVKIMWAQVPKRILIKIDSCCYLQFLVFLFISLLSEQGAILYFAKMSHNPMKLGKIHLQSTLSLVFQCIGLL